MEAPGGLLLRRHRGCANLEDHQWRLRKRNESRDGFRGRLGKRGLEREAAREERQNSGEEEREACRRRPFQEEFVEEQKLQDHRLRYSIHHITGYTISCTDGSLASPPPSSSSSSSPILKFSSPESAFSPSGSGLDSDNSRSPPVGPPSVAEPSGSRSSTFTVGFFPFLGDGTFIPSPLNTAATAPTLPSDFLDRYTTVPIIARVATIVIISSEKRAVPIPLFPPPPLPGSGVWTPANGSARISQWSPW
mmetsp:Transcript_13284/g.28899  ORF Transcript_13284/g.28899 Transcript_13284/m.28899 type:complete len:249 (+) Transcript_13284:207-953(+)